MEENKRKKKGFTLIEVLAVIILLALIIIVVATNGFGAFENAKGAISEENRKTIYEAANVLMTEVKNCEGNEDLFGDLFTKYEITSENKCEELIDKATKKEDGTGCLDIELNYLIDNKYILSEGVKSIQETNGNFIIKGCLNTDTKEIAITIPGIDGTTTTTKKPTEDDIITISFKENVTYAFPSIWEFIEGIAWKERNSTTLANNIDTLKDEGDFNVLVDPEDIYNEIMDFELNSDENIKISYDETIYPTNNSDWNVTTEWNETGKKWDFTYTLKENNSLPINISEAFKNKIKSFTRELSFNKDTEAPILVNKEKLLEYAFARGEIAFSINVDTYEIISNYIKVDNYDGVTTNPFDELDIEALISSGSNTTTIELEDTSGNTNEYNVMYEVIGGLPTIEYTGDTYFYDYVDFSYFDDYIYTDGDVYSYWVIDNNSDYYVNDVTLSNGDYTLEIEACNDWGCEYYYESIYVEGYPSYIEYTGDTHFFDYVDFSYFDDYIYTDGDVYAYWVIDNNRDYYVNDVTLSSGEYILELEACNFGNCICNYYSIYVEEEDICATDPDADPCLCYGDCGDEESECGVDCLFGEMADNRDEWLEENGDELTQDELHSENVDIADQIENEYGIDMEYDDDTGEWTADGEIVDFDNY